MSNKRRANFEYNEPPRKPPRNRFRDVQQAKADGWPRYSKRRSQNFPPSSFSHSRFNSAIKQSQHIIIERKKAVEIKNVFPFLKLPAELRIKIYVLVLDWNNVNKPMQNLRQLAPNRGKVRQVVDLVNRRPIHCTICDLSGNICLHPYIRDFLAPHCPRRSTPSILLVCSQITSEALIELHKKALLLDWPYPLFSTGCLSLNTSKTYPLYTLSHFINSRTLIRVPKLTIRTTVSSLALENTYGYSFGHLGRSWTSLVTMLAGENEDDDNITSQKVLEVLIMGWKDVSDCTTSEEALIREVNERMEQLSIKLPRSWKLVVSRDPVLKRLED